jgi:hypothetical protein
MSSEGLADLVEVLTERAEIQGKKVWLVDHHVLDSGFTGRLVAVMDKEGTSSLEWDSGMP